MWATFLSDSLVRILKNKDWTFVRRGEELGRGAETMDSRNRTCFFFIIIIIQLLITTLDVCNEHTLYDTEHF